MSTFVTTFVTTFVSTFVSTFVYKYAFVIQARSNASPPFEYSGSSFFVGAYKSEKEPPPRTGGGSLSCCYGRLLFIAKQNFVNDGNIVSGNLTVAILVAVYNLAHVA